MKCSNCGMTGRHMSGCPNKHRQDIGKTQADCLHPPQNKEGIKKLNIAKLLNKKFYVDAIVDRINQIIQTINEQEVIIESLKEDYELYVKITDKRIESLELKVDGIVLQQNIIQTCVDELMKQMKDHLSNHTHLVEDRKISIHED